MKAIFRKKITFSLITLLLLFISCMENKVSLDKKCYGEYESMVKEFYPNGQIKSQTDKIKHDTISRYDSEFKEEHVVRVKSFEETNYFFNGKKKSFKKVLGGTKESQWIYWDSIGNIIKEEYYVNDSLIVSISR